MVVVGESLLAGVMIAIVVTLSFLVIFESLDKLERFKWRGAHIVFPSAFGCLSRSRDME